MHFEGNVKRAISVYGTIAFLSAAIFCAISSNTTVKALSVLWLVFGLVSLAGVWATSLRADDESSDSTN